MARRGSSVGTRVHGSVQTSRAERAGEHDTKPSPDVEQDDEYSFPWWWFVLLAAVNIPSQLFATSLLGIVWPATIASVFGEKNKTLALGIVGTVAAPLP